ncbi:MAG: hypothetical protein WBE86_17260 [Candidatus Acidiferrales bacterium]
MTDFDERDKPDKPQDRWREENPSSRPLKLALLAAAIICIIAIVVYLKARHQPPALRDMLQSQPANHPTSRPTPGSLRAEIHLIPLPSSKSQEVES